MKRVISTQPLDIPSVCLCVRYAVTAQTCIPIVVKFRNMFFAGRLKHVSTMFFLILRFEIGALKTVVRLKGMEVIVTIKNIERAPKY